MKEFAAQSATGLAAELRFPPVPWFVSRIVAEVAITEEWWSVYVEYISFYGDWRVFA